MTLHVFAVGDLGDALLRQVFESAVETAELRKIQADSPEELVKGLVQLVDRERRKIDVLDIFDHGNPGVQHFGRPIEGKRPVLFRSDDQFASPLEGDPSKLHSVLSRHAIVRFLGCETGGTGNPSLAVSAGRRGRALVLKVAHLLSEQREVLATLVPVVGPMFGPHGFLDGPAREVMFTSHSAWDDDPPADRSANIRALKQAGFPP